MLKSFFTSREFFVWAWFGLGFIICMVLLQVYLAVVFNEWYKEFYDSMQNYDSDGFIGTFLLKLNGTEFAINTLEKYPVETSWGFVAYGMIGFSVLAFFYIFIKSFTDYFAQHYTFRWRQAMAFYYKEKWRTLEVEIYEGSSQRIQEDCMRFAELSFSLGIGAFRAITTLIAFLPILWGLSENMIFFGEKYAGFLVYIALFMSIGGMIISVGVGWKLPGLHYNNQKVEAAYRKQLVYGEDNKQGYANMKVLTELFTGLRFNYFRLYNNYFYFGLWESFYFQTATILPFVVSYESYFIGKIITFGVVIQISNAFGKVHDSLSFFLDRYVQVTEFSSILKRLTEFEKTLFGKIKPSINNQ